VLLTSTASAVTTANVGAATVTLVSASGSVGNDNNYASTLSTGMLVTNGSVVATENSVTTSSSGVVYETRVGTATYAPATGLVTVALPSAATGSTTVGAAGITTTGGVTAATVTAGTVSAGTLNGNVGGAAGAAGINANNGRIVNLAAGTAATDAVNLGQLNALSTSLNASFTSFQTSVNASLATLTTRADAGTAVAVAMSGSYFLPGKKVNVTANFGSYRGQSAFSGQVGFLISENVSLNAGIATSLNGNGGTAFRGGATFGF
jgi:hypothetical protein